MKKETGKIISINSDLKRRALCFLGSVIFHIFVIGLIVSLFTPVRFQVYEKVTNVIIASPGKLRIPPVDSTTGLEEDISAPRNLPGAEQGPRGASEARRIAGGESEIATERTIRRGKPPQDKIASLPPELTSKFRLDSPQNEKSGFNLNITPAEAEKYETEREMTMDELDLLSYLRVDNTKAQPLRGNPSRKIRVDASTREQPATGNVVEYDITPWAESAVARIQRNWIIPPSKGNEIKKTVEISVVVDKSGVLLSFAIRNSSGMRHLDMAALNAIKLSAPLPALPSDFPLNRLIADLLFQYYE